MQASPSLPQHDAALAVGARQGRSWTSTVNGPQTELRRMWLPSITFLLYNCITPQPGASRPRERPCHCGGEWSLDDLETLFYILSQGSELELAAKHLGKPRDQCRQEVMHLRMVDRIPKLPCEETTLSLQGGSHWSACVQIRLCIELRDGRGLEEVASSLGRSISSCKRQLRLLTDEGTNSACDGCGRRRLCVAKYTSNVDSGAEGACREHTQTRDAIHPVVQREHPSQASYDWPYHYAAQPGLDNAYFPRRSNRFR